jgi:hypothetical protein
MQTDISDGKVSLGVNNGTPADVTISQGTGNFTSQPINFRSRNGTGLFSSGQEYQTIILGRAATADEIVATNAYVNDKTGAY